MAHMPSHSLGHFDCYAYGVSRFHGPSVGYLRTPHDLCTVSLRGEVSSQSIHHAEKHGATHMMMIRVLGSLLTTWYKVQHVEGPPLLPVHQEYAVPRNLYGMSTHILTNPESLPGKWKQWTGDTILWPSPPLLYQVAQQFSLNASLPHIFLPSPDLSSVLYWFVTNFTGHWPATPVGIPSVAFVDTPKPIRLQGCITGVIYWSMKYGYSEHHRYLTCVNQDRHRTFIPQAAVMQHVFKAVFASLAMPVVQEYQDYRIQMQPHRTSDWQVNWLA